MFWPQPTAQYGQTDLTTSSAVSVRGPRAFERGLSTACPRPSGSEPVACRNSGHSPSQVRAPIEFCPPGSSRTDVAEADGNRTRLAEILGHVGVEDRGAHQEP